MQTSSPRRRWLATVVLTAALLTPLRAAAGDTDAEIAKGVSLGVRSMYFRAKDADHGNLSGGAQVRLQFLPMYAIEASIDYRRETFGSTVVDVYPVQTSLVVIVMPFSRLTPYLLGGVGWYYTHVRTPSERTQYRFGPHAGVGLKMSVNRSWSVDGSYRYLWTRDINSEDLAHPAGRNFSDNGFQLTAALNRHF